MANLKENQKYFQGVIVPTASGISPGAYAALRLPDQWIEDTMQWMEAAWIIEQTDGCESVLELGFGSGIIARALRNAERLAMIVDGSAQFVKDAHDEKLPCAHSMFEDFNPFERHDCVIASFVLEHVADPVTLLKRARQWTDKLIVVVGNANSYHRQIAVQMGLQPHLNSLSARDITVGHHMVYSRDLIYEHLLQAGWVPSLERGLGLKFLPNAMLAKLDPAIVKTMVQMECDPEIAANIFLVCIPDA